MLFELSLYHGWNNVYRVSQIRSQDSRWDSFVGSLVQRPLITKTASVQFGNYNSYSRQKTRLRYLNMYESLCAVCQVRCKRM